MICEYCNQEAPAAPIAELKRHGMSVYFCPPCRAEYVLFQSHKLATKSLYTTINDKMYRYTIAYGNIGQIWYVGEPGIPGVRANKKMALVKSFDEDREGFCPELNPSNVNEKLRKWLVFL